MPKSILKFTFLLSIFSLVSNLAEARLNTQTGKEIYRDKSEGEYYLSKEKRYNQTEDTTTKEYTQTGDNSMTAFKDHDRAHGMYDRTSNSTVSVGSDGITVEKSGVIKVNEKEIDTNAEVEASKEGVEVTTNKTGTIDSKH